MNQDLESRISSLETKLGTVSTDLYAGGDVIGAVMCAIARILPPESRERIHAEIEKAAEQADLNGEASAGQLRHIASVVEEIIGRM